MIETIFDYKFYVDKISEFMIDTFDKDQQKDSKSQNTIMQLQSEILGLRHENSSLKSELVK